MSQSAKRVAQTLPQPTQNLASMNINHQLSYRFPMTVAELMVFSSSFDPNAYYVCPRCHITMEREYQSYCDRCGQRLNWTCCHKAKIIYPGADRSK